MYSQEIKEYVFFSDGYIYIMKNTVKYDKSMMKYDKCDKIYNKSQPHQRKETMTEPAFIIM